MNRPVLFSALMAVTAIASSTAPTQAFCLNQDATLSLGRNVFPEDSAFVSSGPANANSEFKLEIDLNDGLDIFSADTEEVDEAAEPDMPEMNDSVTQDTSDEEVTLSANVDDLAASSGSAADLDATELEPQTIISREDYLNSRAVELNSCR
ncbi:MAG: hypothetical protein ACFB0E_09400 [Leptolyngbyaceae cyanobacterium]